MKIDLSTGEAKIKIYYDVVKAEKPYQSDRRRTNVELTFTLPASAAPETSEPVTLKESATCNHKDTFNRTSGRKEAAKKVLEGLTAFAFTRDDRTKVFRAICPEFAPKPAAQAQVASRS